MICIYHRTDMDGKCAGAIVLHKFPECRLYPIDYADKFNISMIDDKEDVIMVDMTLEKPGEMLSLIDQCGKLTWIDHHNTSIDIEKQLEIENVAGIRQISSNSDDPKGTKNRANKISGCELTWNYFYPDRRIPYAVYLIGRFDIWENTHRLWDSHITPFQYGMRLDTWYPHEQDNWAPLFKTSPESKIIEQKIHDGNVALKYERNLSERMAKGTWFPIEFKGLKFQAINRSLGNSIAGESIWNPEEFDAIMFFCKGPETWRITMFTDKRGIDLYPIAKSMGGGGHSQACGFTVRDIMDTIPQLIKF